jgi:hypothetical protein
MARGRCGVCRKHELRKMIPGSGNLIDCFYPGNEKGYGCIEKKERYVVLH